MPEQFNVIALVSGGKDSFFSILHALHHGHKVVALANLCPPQEADGTVVDDMDSMTYQTIGHKVIPLYSHCVNIPVFQRAIRGTTVCDQQDYAIPDKAEDTYIDETEDLFELLKMVKSDVPEANAVSSGAILSTYQRTRVESVVLRLGMVPLAYLWQYPFLPPPPGREDSSTGLLEDMIAAGCDARIIKIASYGVVPALMNASLADAHNVRRLAQGFRRKHMYIEDEAEFRAAVVGEGGEFETLAVNGPRRLWKRRIEWKPTREHKDGEALAYVDDKPRCIPQDDNAQVPDDSVRIPREFDAQFWKVLERCRRSRSLANTATSHSKRSSNSNIDDAQRNSGRHHLDLRMSRAFSESHVSISNITAAMQDSPSSVIHELSAADQMAIIGEVVKALLQNPNVQLGGNDVRSVTSTMLLLSSMDDFPAVNLHYAQLFSFINPPARCTFAATLPEGIKVSLNINIDLRPLQTRRCLHVQSRSYWAPANIGPYSQAVSEPLMSKKEDSDGDLTVQAELVSVAGQIPLRPITMEIAFNNVILNAALSLQHLWRVGQERKVDLWTWVIAFVQQGVAAQDYASSAFDVWQTAHETPARREEPQVESDSEFDVWDLANGRTRDPNSGTFNRTTGEHIHVLPNWTAMIAGQCVVPPFVAAEVLQLPRSVPIEWWSTGLGKLPKEKAARMSHSSCESSVGEVSTMMYSTFEYSTIDPPGRARFVSFFIKKSDEPINTDHVSQRLRKLLGLFHNVEGGRSLVVSGHCLFAGSEGAEHYRHLAAERLMQGIAAIPCRNLWVCPAVQLESDSATSEELSEAVLVLLVRLAEAPNYGIWAHQRGSFLENRQRD